MFPGADYTMAADAIMPDGRTLQVGTCHHLGDNFSKTFDLSYEDENGERKLAHQTCYGISERCIAAMISIHGDDKGLVLPPEVAPVQVVIVPIIMKKNAETVIAAAKELEKEIKAAGLRVKIDARELRPGAKYYHWEMRGVPLRIEIGQRDIDGGTVMAVDRYGVKTAVKRSEAVAGIKSLLEAFKAEMKARAMTKAVSQINTASTIEEAKAAVEKGVAVVQWCGCKECADAIEQGLDVSVLGSEVRSEHIADKEGRCIICGKPAKPAIVARTY